jgi:hypothetical protein
VSAFRHLGITALTLVLLCLLHLGLFAYQLGAPMPAEYWLHECRVVKQALVRKVPSPKLIVVGGSNALVGIDSGVLEQSVGLPTFNLSLHGGLLLWQTLPDAEGILQPGDVVLLAPAYAAFSPKQRYDEWLTDQVMTWNTGYFKGLDPVEKARFVSAVPLRRILEGCLVEAFGGRLAGVEGRRIRPEAEILEEYERGGEYGVQETTDAYSPLNLTRRGDVMRTVSIRVERSDYGLSQPYQENQDTWRALRAFRDNCRAREVDVYVTWPPSVKSSLLDFEKEPVRRHLAEITRRFEDLQIPVLGEPHEFQYQRQLFSDLDSHLNDRGRSLRTARLAELLRQRLTARAQASLESVQRASAGHAD